MRLISSDGYASGEPVRCYTVLVAHPEAMFGEALAAALESHPMIAPVAVVTSAAAAADHPQRLDAAAVSAELPGAVVLVRELRARGTRVVVLGEADDEVYGVSVAPTSSIATLAAALIPGAGRRVRPTLSKREHEVLSLAARGLAAKQIAGHLGISSKTVEHHKSRAFRKLGVPNQAAAISVLSSNPESRYPHPSREEPAWIPSSI